MSLYRLKTMAGKCIGPLARLFARMSVTANEITLATLILMLITGIVLALWAPANPGLWLLLPMMLLIRIILNLVDGVLARQELQITPLGGLLSVVGDAIADVVLYLPLAYVPQISVSMVVIVVCLTLITEVTGLAALSIGAERNHSGPLGKSDRCVVFGIIGVLLAFQLLSARWLNGCFVLIALLLVITIIRRMQTALTEVGYFL